MKKKATSKCFYAHSIITEAARPTEIVIISKKLTETARRESNTQTRDTLEEITREKCIFEVAIQFTYTGENCPNFNNF